MDIKKSLTYKIENDRYVYTLSPKDIQNANIGDQETLINNFFETFDIIVSNKGMPSVKVPSEPTIIKPARKKRSPVIEIWNNAKQYLDNEFDANEYWDALKKAGYEYKNSTKEAIPYQQLINLVKLNKVERVGDRPAKWKKVFLKTSEEGTEEFIKSLKEGKKVEIGITTEILKI